MHLAPAQPSTALCPARSQHLLTLAVAAPPGAGQRAAGEGAVPPPPRQPGPAAAPAGTWWAHCGACGRARLVGWRLPPWQEFACGHRAALLPGRTCADPDDQACEWCAPPRAAALRATALLLGQARAWLPARLPAHGGPGGAVLPACQAQLLCHGRRPGWLHLCSAAMY